MDYTESILDSIKKLLGLTSDYTSFDMDIIIHINTVFMALRQMGIGPKEGFSIEGNVEIWTDFSEKIEMLEAVKTYIYLKVKLIFDPPLNSSVIEVYNKTLSELEWRLYSEVEFPVE